MKLCLKCNAQIKFYVKIDGKQRSLKNRKYCLECSPFKSNNRTKLHLLNEAKPNLSKIGTENTCKTCNKVFMYRGKSDNIDKCQTCYNKQIRRKLKLKYIEYKGGKCEICGYNKCLKALVFHHIDPALKEFQISSALTKSWEANKAELDKCQLLCANCHAEVHFELDNNIQ